MSLPYKLSQILEELQALDMVGRVPILVLIVIDRYDVAECSVLGIYRWGVGMVCIVAQDESTLVIRIGVARHLSRADERPTRSTIRAAEDAEEPSRAAWRRVVFNAQIRKLYGGD